MATKNVKANMKINISKEMIHNINLFDKVIKNILNNNLYLNKNFTNKQEFNLKNFSIKKYVSKIVLNTRIETSTLILSMYYIDKLIDKKFNLNINNIHVVILVTLIIGTKINQDINLNFNYYSNIGSFSNDIIKFYEIIILEKLEYKLIINLNEYNCYKIHFM